MAKRSHLYVMQNNLGLIKIGQSCDVEHRCRRLERADQCQIQVVHVVENGGSQERDCLALLRKHQEYGEWFSGDAPARRDVARLLGLPKDMAWPYSLADDDAIDEWIAKLDELRSTESMEKLSLRVISNMKSRHTPGAFDHFYFNFKIWQIIWEYDQGLSPGIWTDSDENGQALHWAIKDSECEPEPLPSFTTDISAALLIWPDEIRPEWWDGPAWDCCIEGLKARRAAMMKRNRQRRSSSKPPRRLRQ